MNLTLLDVVRKLSGPIEPIGQSGSDEIRFANLKEYCLLAEEMVRHIRDITKKSSSYEGSVRRAGEFAKRSIEEIKELIADGKV